MSERTKNLLATTLLLVLAATAFIAGYFTNDFIELRRGQVTINVDEEPGFHLFWEAWGHIENNFIGNIPTTKEVTYGAIRGAVALLNDPYTVFIEPIAREEERINLQGTFGGVGATLSRPEEGGPIFLEPIPGNPAAMAGILTGDILLAVNSTPITVEMTVQEVAELVRGEKGTIVVLTVLHPNAEEEVEIEIERGDILVPSVSTRILREDAAIGYIQLTRFSGESTKEVEAGVSSLLDQGAEMIILDLRGNGGGLVDAAVDIADLFLDEGVVLYQQTNQDEENVFSSTNNTMFPDIPMVLLIDGGSASAAEILAGALQDRGRAMLVGSSPTFGKGSVQLVYDLSDGSSIHVTSSRWLTPDRNQLDQRGIQPDLMVTITQEDIDNGRDAVLNQAIFELQNQ